MVPRPLPAMGPYAVVPMENCRFSAKPYVLGACSTSRSRPTGRRLLSSAGRFLFSRCGACFRPLPTPSAPAAASAAPLPLPPPRLLLWAPLPLCRRAGCCADHGALCRQFLERHIRLLTPRNVL